MATGHFPWLEVKRTSTADLFAYVTTHNVAPACPTHFSPELHDFLGAIFDRDADRRPAAAALLRHAFLEEPDDADELNSSFTELEAHHEVFAKIERIAKESDAPRPARSRSAPNGQEKQPNPYRRAKSDAAKNEKHRSRNPYARKKKAPGAIRVDGADEAKRAEPSPYGRSSASDAASVATTPDALDATLKGAAAAAVKAALDELAPSTPSTLATPSPVDDGSSRRAVFKMPAWQKTTAETDRHDTVYLAPRASPARPRTAPPVPYRGDDAAAAPKANNTPPAEPPAAARPPPATGTASARPGSAVGALYFAQFLKNKSKRPDSREAPTSSRSLGDARPAEPGAPPPSSRSLDGH